MDEAWSARVKAWLREKAMSHSVHQSAGGDSTAQSRQPSTGESLMRPQPYEHMPYQATPINPENLSSNVWPPLIPQAPTEAVVEPIPPPVRMVSPSITVNNQSSRPHVDMATATEGPSQRILPEDLDAAAEAAMAHLTYQNNTASPHPSPFKTTKVLDMRLEDLLDDDMKKVLRQRGLSSERRLFISESPSPFHCCPNFLFDQDTSQGWGSRKETYPDETSQTRLCQSGILSTLCRRWSNSGTYALCDMASNLLSVASSLLNFPLHPFPRYI